MTIQFSTTVNKSYYIQISKQNFHSMFIAVDIQEMCLRKNDKSVELSKSCVVNPTLHTLFSNKALTYLSSGAIHHFALSHLCYHELVTSDAKEVHFCGHVRNFLAAFA